MITGGSFQREQYRPGRFRRLCWFTTGADIALLCDAACPESERMRFAALGGTMLTITGLALLSGALAFYQIFYPGTNAFEVVGTPWRFSISLVFATLWTLTLYNMQRFLIFGSQRVNLKAGLDRGDYLALVPGLLFSVLIGLTVATPLQVVIFAREINAQLTVDRLDQQMQLFGDIDRRFAGETRRLLQARFDRESIVRVARMPVDGPCAAHAVMRSAPEDALATVLAQCLEQSTAFIEATAGQLRAQQDLPGTGSESVREQELDLEAALHEARIENQKLQALQTVLHAPGLLKRSSLAYSADPLFSWVFLLTIIFVQTIPVLVRLMSVRGPYDDLVDMSARVVLAREGIEPAVLYLFPEQGDARAVDHFHRAKQIEREVQALLLNRRRDLRQQRRDEYRRRIEEIQQRQDENLHGQ